MMMKSSFVDIRVNHETVIALDLDDTLYPEFSFLQSAYIEIAQKLEINNWKILYAKMISMYRSQLDVFKEISNNYGISKNSLLLTYRQHLPNISLFPFVMNKLIEIKSHGGRLAIITDGRNITQHNKIMALGLSELIDLIVISENTGKEKPDFNNFRIVEQAFPNYHYTYIADNLSKDFLGPNRLNWFTLGIIDGGTNIHFDMFDYITNDYLPDDFVLSFKYINIIPHGL